MPIDTTTPLTREEWNEEIIQAVNDLCSSPDVGCDVITPLEKVDPDHIWTKTDITTVQDKLKEMCSTNTFPDLEDPQLWTMEECITPILEALALGWCDCEPDETTYELGSFPQQTLAAGSKPENSDPFVESIPWQCGGFRVLTYLSPYYPPKDNSATLSVFRSTLIAIGTAYWGYKEESLAVFRLEDDIEDVEGEIETLEDEIETLEDETIPAAEAQLTALEDLRDFNCGEDPGGTLCSSYTTQANNKQAEIDELNADLTEKEDELAEKESELADLEADEASHISTRDGHRSTWDSQAQIQWAALAAYELRYPTDVQPLRDYFPTLDEPWGDYWEDTRTWPVPLWTYLLDKFSDGTDDLARQGNFSPGGYPYYGGVDYQSFTEIERTCKYFEWTREDACTCAWDYPSLIAGLCSGEDAIWYFAVLGGVVQALHVECANIRSQDYSISMIVKHAPEYTRPSE